ncbi:Light-sensor Protein kinase [Glycine soja]
MQRKKLINSNKYRKEYGDMKLFHTSSLMICHRYDTVRKEDRFLYNKIHEKKVEGITMYEKKLIDLLLRNLERSESLVGRLLPSSTLVGSKDYQVRRRKGNASQYKEITWLGESFVIRHFSCDIEALEPEIIELLSLSHPNIMDSGFTVEEKKECFLIARGMEYLHSKKVYHGELNPSSILVKPRGTSPEGYLHAKYLKSKIIQGVQQTPSTQKSDVYSFGMVFFELLTGKVPFEDSHIQGKKMSRNTREGERPLFPLNSPKYRCWHIDPHQRPSFSTICRVLRYIKRFLVLNPGYSSQPEPPVPPVVDYCHIESVLPRKFPSWGTEKGNKQTLINEKSKQLLCLIN